MTSGGNTKAGGGGSPPKDDGERRASRRLAAKRQTKQRAREEGKQRSAAAAAAVAQAAAAAGAAVGVGDGGRHSTDSSQGQQPQLQQPPNAVFVIAGSKPQQQPQQQQQGQEQPQPQQQHQGQQQQPSAAAGTAVAIATGLSESLAAVAAAPAAAAARVRRPSYELECGLWGLLPEELLEIILRQCEAQQLGMLESSCSFFHGNRTLDRIARSKLKAIPRARGLKPNKAVSETVSMLLHYVNCQSVAAAQATAISCGAYHTATLMLPRRPGMQEAQQQQMRHSMHMFGRGFHGQLGTGDHSSLKFPTSASLGFKPCLDPPDAEEETMPAVVACGAHHSTAISRKGELYSWGLGCNGELGLGRWGPIELTTPRQCSAPQVRIVSVACGAHHTLAIAENGSLWSCGMNRMGQLGVGTMVDGSRLQGVLSIGGYRIVSVAAGAAHSMALASDGSLFTWGDGSMGQLGHSQLQQVAGQAPVAPVTMHTPVKITRLDPSALAPENRITAIAAGSNFSMALTVGGSILAFGANTHGQLGTGDQVDRWKPTRVSLGLPGEERQCLRVVQLACGTSFTVALMCCHGSLEVRTTGSNTYGQLGHGDRIARYVFKPTMKIPDVVAVQAGDEHAAAITSMGDLYMWGRGDSGQLGMNDNRAKWKPTLLREFVIVHPDKTLRRNKRSLPYVRRMEAVGSSACSAMMPRIPFL